jgi:hypothetical protein
MKLYPTIKKMLYPVLDESIKSVFISIDVHNALMIHITSSYILMNVVLFLGFNFYSSLHVLPSRRIAPQALSHSMRSRDVGKKRSFTIPRFMVLLWRSGRVVKAFDSNLSRLWVSNPFVGKSSNLLGVDMFFLFLLVSLYISYLEGRYMEGDRAEFPFVCNGWCVCTFLSPQIFVSFGGQRAIVIRRGNIGFKRRSGLFFFVFI